MKTLLSHLINKLIFVYFITQTDGLLSCNLKYSKNDWLNEWGVLVTQNENNHYQLLRDHNVTMNQIIFTVCNNKQKPIPIGCSINNEFNETLPLKNKCNEGESMIPVRIAEKVSYCPHTLYKIGFNIKIDSSVHFMETYRVCFDQKHVRTLFTISTAYPVGGSRPSFLHFEPDDIFYGRLFSAFSRRSSFERFKTLLGKTQTYMSASNVNHIIDRGHLTPSADFTLINLKRSTFNMINVMPQFKTIDNGNWRLIEEWIRHPSQAPAHVCTGVFDCDLDANNNADLNCVLKLQDAKRKWIPIFLNINRTVPIPLWSYKIVKTNLKDSLVFLTLNNIYHKGNVQVSENVCKEIECPLKLQQTVKDGWTFCCSYNEFIINNVPYLRDVC